MPYVNKTNRMSLDQAGFRLPTGGTAEPGNLNYMITKLVDQWLCMNGKSYTTLNAALGVLEGVKLELYRRIAAPYEDQKLHDNGDVFAEYCFTPMTEVMKR